MNDTNRYLRNSRIHSLNSVTQCEASIFDLEDILADSEIKLSERARDTIEASVARMKLVRSWTLESIMASHGNGHTTPNMLS